MQPASTAPETLFSSIGGSYSIAWAFDSCGGGMWHSYDPDAPPFLNNLETVDETMGVWLLMSAADTLSVSGAQPESASIPLCTGWNLVGFPSAAARSVEDALASINGCYDIVWCYDAAQAAWHSYDPDAPPFLNSLTQLEPGRGCWILTSQDCTWTVPYTP